MNLGKLWSVSLTRLINLAIDSASKSTFQLKHGAVLFSSKNSVCQTSYNQHGNRICGYDVPSIHAEANCLNSIYKRHVGRRKVRREKGVSDIGCSYQF
jgi:hypothetical protein